MIVNLLKKYKLLIGTGAIVIGAGTLIVEAQPKDTQGIIIQLQDPQQIVWEKPTTDAAWAEDVKADQLDIRSTEALNSMLALHIQRLDDIKKSNDELLNCESCTKFRLSKDHPDWSATDINNEYLNQKNAVVFQQERVTQVVERIQNELRLRESGYFTVQKTVSKQSDGNPTLSKVRKVIE